MPVYVSLLRKDNRNGLAITNARSKELAAEIARRAEAMPETYE